MITHEQASILRTISSIPPQLHPNLEWIERHNLHGLIHAVWHGTMWTVCGLTGNGYSTLAEYEAAHVTLTKEQLGEVFKVGYEHGWNDRTGNHDEVDFVDERWRDSNIWDNLQADNV